MKKIALAFVIAAAATASAFASTSAKVADAKAPAAAAPAPVSADTAKDATKSGTTVAAHKHHKPVAKSVVKAAAAPTAGAVAASAPQPK